MLLAMGWAGSTLDGCAWGSSAARWSSLELGESMPSDKAYLVTIAVVLRLRYRTLTPEMNSREKLCLQSVQDLILRDVCACDVQDYLFETGVLTLDDLTSLEEEKNPKRRIEMVLQWVQERPATFQHFSDSLRDRHPYIIQEMENAQASASDCSPANHQPVSPTKNYVIEGDGNFVVADSENTRVHMKRRDIPAGQGPS